MTNVIRRLGGTIGVVLMLAISALVLRLVNAPARGSYTLIVDLGDAGSGLAIGSDVKVRGVVVGKVERLDLAEESGNAIATLRMAPPREGGEIPTDVDVVVTAKTLLGEKQVVLEPHRPIGEEPVLEDGARLAVDPDRQPTEVQDVLAALEPFFDAIDPRELGLIVDAFGSFTVDDAEIAAHNIELTEDLAEFGADTASAQVDRLSALADLAGELSRTADDFNRLNRTLPGWVNLLPDRQADVRANLQALSDFSNDFGNFLTVEEADFDRLLEVGSIVGAVVEPRDDRIAAFIYGVYRYSLKLGHHGGSLDDGTEHAWFHVMVGGEGGIAQICNELPPQIRDTAPGCVPEPDAK